MPTPSPKLTELAHEILRGVLRPGDWAVDATAGNGHDTVFLARQVGPAGRVFAFDIQPAAIAATRQALRANGLENVELIEGSHAEMLEYIPGNWIGAVGAVAFNLGYLPGGDKAIVTRPASTVKAIGDALRLLRPGGVLTVLAYPGHPGGRDEAESVAELLAGLTQNGYECGEIQSAVDGAQAPILYCINPIQLSINHGKEWMDSNREKK